MKRFNWKLQRVLDIRQKEEQVRRAELVALTERLSQARGKLFMQKRILRNLIDSIAEEEPRARLARQPFFMSCSAVNTRIIRLLEEEIRTLTVHQKEKMDEILKLKQFNEGLEKLREEARTEFIKTQEKLEQRNMDEAATFRFARKIMTQSQEVHT